MSVPGLDPRDGDQRRWGLPEWATRDEGPTNTYVPGPLPTTPLINTYQWLPRVLLAGVVFLGAAVMLLLSSQVGKVSAALLLVAVWLAYSVPTGWKGQFGLSAEGDVLRVRSARGVTEVRGDEVRQVRYVHQGASPDFRLVLPSGTAVYVATSRLERGHSTLFEWLRLFAPNAVYDEKSLGIRDRLVSRGLIGGASE